MTFWEHQTHPGRSRALRTLALGCASVIMCHGVFGSAVMLGVLALA